MRKGLPIFAADIHFHTIEVREQYSEKSDKRNLKREYRPLNTFVCGNNMEEVLREDDILTKRLHQETLKSKDKGKIVVTEIIFKTQHGKTNW